MIIDAKQYSGKCACGKEHAMSTEFCIIEDGCLSMFDELTSRYGITGIVPQYTMKTPILQPKESILRRLMR